ncbi:unnamed protein product [Leptosia nina]|uniref:Peptidase S1 domain-containing protein n=1 Tax=Leptosia nina TaxID=320188 RepID=A0AAV1K0V6_9NEOP
MVSMTSGSLIIEHFVPEASSGRIGLKRSFDKIRVVGGILHTITQQPFSHEIQQWRNVKHVYSQRFYRFPAFNLAIVEVNTNWLFNQFVNKIPYSQKNYDFDGVCMGVILKTTRSWSKDKSLFTTDLKIHRQRLCEHKLLRSCWQYYCSEYVSALASTETEGGGLVCYGTGDPAEDEKLGVLVGVTSLINQNLPNVHLRIGVFHKWVTDSGGVFQLNRIFFVAFVFVIIY